MLTTYITQRKQTSLGRLQDVWRRSWLLTTKPDIFKTSGRRRRIYDVLKTSNLHRLEDVRFITSWRSLFYNVLKTSQLRRLEDVGFTSSWRCLIYNVLETSVLRRLEDVSSTTSSRFTTFWRRLIYDILKMSDLQLLDDPCKTTSVEEATSAQRQRKLVILILYCLKYWENFKCSA